MTTLVDLDVALAGSGLRLVLLAGAPSPWSEAALAILRYKKLSFRCARSRTVEPAFQAWKGARNLPALLMDDQPIRTGWAEILALAESLKPEPSLVPSDPEERIRMVGLCHELMDEGGLSWCTRLLAIDAGLSSDGREGFSLRAAQHLAPRYGWTASCAPMARDHAVEVLALLDRELTQKAGPYYSGNSITALDLYSAAALNALVPLPDADCPMAAPVRAAFTWMGRALGDAITATLLAHRERVVSELFELPIAL
ncbi:MAG TPA: hypothetical protein VGF76_00010 [Polyangiaceae bacterium]|jgi:glutathione S-transferase